MNRKEKRQARIVTLQTIYANEVSGVDIDAMLVHIAHDLNLDNNHSIILYSAELSKLTIKNKIEIDKIIISHSKNWDFSRIALIDRLILRIELAEMLYVDEVPHKVSITEGVEIAKEYSTDDSGGFVNGILDAVYNNVLKGKVA